MLEMPESWEAANRVWDQSKKKYVSSTKLKEVGPENHSDTRNRDIGFRVCPAGFRSFFGPVFLHYVFFLPFWKGTVYSVILYI